MVVHKENPFGTVETLYVGSRPSVVEASVHMLHHMHVVRDIWEIILTKKFLHIVQKINVLEHEA